MVGNGTPVRIVGQKSRPRLPLLFRKGNDQRVSVFSRGKPAMQAQECDHGADQGFAFFQADAEGDAKAGKPDIALLASSRGARAAKSSKKQINGMPNSRLTKAAISRENTL